MTNLLHNTFEYLSSKVTSQSNTNQEEHFENKNIQFINNLSQQKLNKYDKNCFFSMYGLFCLLEMLKNGTYEVSEIHEALKELMDDQNIMNIAKTNDIFKNTSLIFHASYLDLSDKFSEYLKANNIFCDSIDMSKLQQRIDQINQTVSEMTNDKIKNPLDPNDFDLDFVMLLINVLYFRADWSKKFYEATTKKILFKNGKNVKIDMMTMLHEDYNYYESNTCQYISLPYTNYSYKMVVALPKEDKYLNSVNLEEALQNMRLCTVTTLMLPKFRIEQTEELNEECTNMGLGKMFVPSNDFDLMFKNSIAPKYIKKIKQKTFINVDENGTEAAAVTYAIMNCESLRKRQKRKEVEFIADHPFSFFVMGPRDIVLFAGKFYNY
jgi:serine protease inhibitor